MSEFFRRASDVFRRNSRQNSIDSTNSSKVPVQDQEAPDSQQISSNRSSQSDTAVPVTETQRKREWHWGFGRQKDPNALPKRRLSQEEKDNLNFAAARKYSNARRKSQGAGIGFEGGWQ
ncbi:uncharacterized protein N7469_003830 [Penicillium citrinum]|uniref:Uncharacterized protein n=2 Tax=Penicillium TaxID=5073 RepID=A0A9W9P3H0_PENCI|nr:uncharacterized protein N7469_003830 [Penicillium citrinum]KAJ5234662.1 hypothetical protein N7469_003830 [Penicillium citrinum]KAJ5590282.1 hypothetical protein N7450_004254 [Penicillium hetheringtonii]